MVKILIIYDSRTGNTEKMALAITEGAQQINGVEAIVKKVEKATLQDLQEADGIVMGTPTYYGQMSGKLKAFIDESTKIHGKLKGKVGAAFTSSGGTASGAETTLLSILQTMLIHGMIIQGRHDDKHYGAASVEGPDQEGIESCKELGKRVASLAERLRSS
ncbi:flavodoxin [Candidatus Bathyarchaeota archaeon RBG_13_46_16b]|nr:MAG: flavodoxin [Candidatus Bathyarchaeota archaeon RBG_13_46_16b]